jgi:hypothetical protein
MYLRFTLLRRDDDSGRKQGILVAAHLLRDEGDLSVEEHRQLHEALVWFNQNLNHPACLKQPGNRRALSWFKPEARKPLAYMWALTHMLNAHGVHVEVHKTRDPGIILYQDGWQVVAKPRRGQRGSW